MNINDRLSELGINNIRVLIAIIFNLQFVILLSYMGIFAVPNLNSFDIFLYLNIAMTIAIIIFSFQSILKGGRSFDRYNQISILIVTTFLILNDYLSQTISKLELNIVTSSLYLSIIFTSIMYLTILQYVYFKGDRSIKGYFYTNNLFNLVFYFIFLNLYVYATHQNPIYLAIYTLNFITLIPLIMTIEKLELDNIEKFLEYRLNNDFPIINLNAIENISKHRIMNKKYVTKIINNIESKQKRSIQYSVNYENFNIYNSIPPFSNSDDGIDLVREYVFPPEIEISIPIFVKIYTFILIVILYLIANAFLFVFFSKDVLDFKLGPILIFTSNLVTFNLIIYHLSKIGFSVFDENDNIGQTEFKIYSNGLWIPNWMTTFQKEKQIFLPFENIRQIKITNEWENRQKFPDYEFRVEILAIDDTKFRYTGQNFGGSMDITSMKEIYESLVDLKSQLGV